MKDWRNDFVRDFLFEGGSPSKEGESLRIPFAAAPYKEGWIGIPHGGISMAAVMEMAANLAGQGGLPFPIAAEFRLGGTPLRIGQEALLRVERTGEGIKGLLTVDEDPSPYLAARIRPGWDDGERLRRFKSYLPGALSGLPLERQELPHYENCFVCGRNRSRPGLECRIFIPPVATTQTTALSFLGFSEGDRTTALLFQRDGFIHPIVPLALLDETMGWAGFVAAAGGAVTVRIAYTFYRPPAAGERFVFLGRCEELKAGAGRLFFRTSGGMAAVAKDGSLEPVAASAGQYLCLPELTEQMRQELRPPELTERLFAAAAARGAAKAEG